jgi:hypothetical protein
MIRVWAIFLLVLVVATLCYSDVGTLHIAVRDADTGYAVNATVGFEGPQTLSMQTSQCGALSVQLQTGEYNITVSALGYKTLKSHTGVTLGKNLPGTVMLDPNSPPDDLQPARLAAEIRPGFTLLHGFIVDDCGRPIAGVNVRVKDGKVGTETDAKGHFSLYIPTPAAPSRDEWGVDTIIYSKPDYQTLIVENMRIGGDDLWSVPFSLQKGSGVIRRNAARKF